MTLLSPMTGTIATGNLTVTATGADVVLPKNSYAIPIIPGAAPNAQLSPHVLLKTTEETTVTAAGVAVPVKTVFGGIGGYKIDPDTVAPPYAAFADQKETAFGWHFGTEAIFRVYKSAGIVLRATYHNVSATPHRQFINANVGAVVRF